MSSLVDTLQDMGCDMDITMERFLGDEELYEECFKDMLCEQGFVDLGEALQSGDVRKSFEYAHMLKGIVINLGVKPLAEILDLLVEPLRKGEMDGLLEKYNHLMEAWENCRQVHRKCSE